MVIEQRLKNFNKDFAHYFSSCSSAPLKLLARHFVHHIPNGGVYLPRDALERAYNRLCTLSMASTLERAYSSKCATIGKVSPTDRDRQCGSRCLNQTFRRIQER